MYSKVQSGLLGAGAAGKKLAMPVGIDLDDFAGLDFALHGDAEVFEGARFGGDDPAVAEPADAERADAHGVAHGEERVAGHDDEAVGAFDAAHHVVEAFFPGAAGGDARGGGR